MSTPVVLLHPLGADGIFWTPIVERLADVEVRTPDLLGHGSAPLSTRGGGVAELTDAVPWDEPAVVVGLSLGGLVAQDLAARRPEAVSHLVLVDTVATYPSEFVTMWRQRASVARRDGLSSLVDATMNLWFSDDADPITVDRARRTFRATDPEGYARTCDLLAEIDLTRWTSSLDVPTTVVVGRDDAPPFVAAAHSFAAQIRGAELVMLKGRHAVAVERPDDFAALVRDLR